MDGIQPQHGWIGFGPNNFPAPGKILEPHQPNIKKEWKIILVYFVFARKK